MQSLLLVDYGPLIADVAALVLLMVGVVLWGAWRD